MITDGDHRILQLRIDSLENEVKRLRETLRDKYAAAAVDGMLSYGWGPDDLMSERAWKIADLMLQARGK